MDSYQFYHLYHTNVESFIAAVEDGDKCVDELLLAMKNLIFNTDLIINEKLRNICYKRVVEMIRSDGDPSNYLLDEVLEAILWHTYDFPLPHFTAHDLDVNHLRIIRSHVRRKKPNSDFINKTSEILIEALFLDSAVHHYIAGLLKLMMKDEIIEKKTLKAILDRCQDDTLSLQNFCLFLDKICELKMISSNDTKVIEKFFKVNTKLSRKQGIFVIKTLLAHNLLADIESWKSLTIILENLDENSSHLILPTLELMQQMKNDGNFRFYWFFTIQMILRHDSSSVKCWGLNFILGFEKIEKSEILEILKALNSTILFDDKELSENVKGFVRRNFDGIFERLVEVEWTSVPFFNVLESVVEVVRKMESFSSIFLAQLQKQTEVIPKRIINLAIREGVQILYTQILERIMKMSGFVQVLPTVISVFKITSNCSSIDGCLRYAQREDHEFIFNPKFPSNFLKYCLSKLYIERDLSEMRLALRKTENPRRILMETICELNKTVDGYEEAPDVLIHEVVDEIFKEESQNILEDVETLDIGLNAMKNSIESGVLDHLVEIWRLLEKKRNSKEEFEIAYWKVLILILKHHKNFDASLIESENDKINLKIPLECQIYLLKQNGGNFTSKTFKFLENIEDFIEIARNEKDIENLIEIFTILSEIWTPEGVSEDIEDKLTNCLKSCIKLADDRGFLSITFWERFLLISSNFAKKSPKLEENLNEMFSWYLARAHEGGIFEILKAAVNLAKNSENNKFQLMTSIKENLAEKIFDADVMARETQIEFSLGCKITQKLRDKLEFRLEIATFLHNFYPEDFQAAIESKIQLDLTTLSKKKPRYFTNSQFHRRKVHLLQPLAFLSEISEKTVEALLFELTQVNNQLSVTFYLEILLAKFCPNLLERLQNELAVLKVPPLKSICTICVLQIKMLTTFEPAEKFLSQIFDAIFPLAMGQNFGVRTYAMVAIFLSLNHLKSLTDFTTTHSVAKISDICELLVKSWGRKNAEKYFLALCGDFRFERSLTELFGVTSFYGRIPEITKMPFEEILGCDEAWKDVRAVEMVKFSEDQTQCDELEVSGEVVRVSDNLQQKYLPYKFKMPGDNLLRTLPSAFKFYDEKEMTMTPKSDLIVCASLIDRSNNLGGLARSCEIFGVSNYVINSLQMTENLDFKSLSKTAEKWLKITEIRSFQVMDYLMAMKQAGYAIIGAEQSGSSTSLVDAKMPRKSVLLLGNEKEGIPVDLLSLLDLTIEIPQIGVVRSLNVHVTASILLWEYAKQHLIRQNL